MIFQQIVVEVYLSGYNFWPWGLYYYLIIVFVSPPNAFVSGVIPFCQKVSLYKIVFIFFVGHWSHQEEFWVFPALSLLEKEPLTFLDLRVSPLLDFDLHFFLHSSAYDCDTLLQLWRFLKTVLIFVCRLNICLCQFWMSVLLIRTLVLRASFFFFFFF